WSVGHLRVAHWFDCADDPGAAGGIAGAVARLDPHVAGPDLCPAHARVLWRHGTHRPQHRRDTRRTRTPERDEWPVNPDAYGQFSRNSGIYQAVHPRF